MGKSTLPLEAKYLALLSISSKLVSSTSQGKSLLTNIKRLLALLGMELEYYPRLCSEARLIISLPLIVTTPSRST